MNQENKKIVLFDFDGVLINTTEFCYDIHLTKNKDLTWDRFQSYADGNFHDGFDKAVKEGKHILADKFHEQYKDRLHTMTVQDVLHESIISLTREYILVIISSTPTTIISDYLQKEKIREFFTEILGYDVHRSKVVKIKSILEKYNITSNNAVFITDTLGDIKEAEECNVPSIGVTWGLHHKERLIKGNPSMIIDSPHDLIPAIKNVLK